LPAAAGCERDDQAEEYSCYTSVSTPQTNCTLRTYDTTGGTLFATRANRYDI
jgi:hypothetical protein